MPRYEFTPGLPVALGKPWNPMKPYESYLDTGMVTFVKPTEVDIEGSRATSTVEYATSEEAYYKSLGLSLDAEARMGFGKISASFRYNKTRESTRNKMHLVLKVQQTYEAHSTFGSEATDYATTLISNTKGKEEWIDLLANSGPTLVTNVQYGFALCFIYEISSATTKFDETMALAIRGKFKNGGFKAGMETALREEFKDVKVGYKVYVTGETGTGDPSLSESKPEPSELSGEVDANNQQLKSPESVPIRARLIGLAKHANDYDAILGKLEAIAKDIDPTSVPVLSFNTQPMASVKGFQGARGAQSQFEKALRAFRRLLPRYVQREQVIDARIRLIDRITNLLASPTGYPEIFVEGVDELINSDLENSQVDIGKLEATFDRIVDDWDPTPTKLPIPEMWSPRRYFEASRAFQFIGWTPRYDPKHGGHGIRMRVQFLANMIINMPLDLLREAHFKIGAQRRFRISGADIENHLGVKPVGSYAPFTFWRDIASSTGGRATGESRAADAVLWNRYQPALQEEAMNQVKQWEPMSLEFVLVGGESLDVSLPYAAVSSGGTVLEYPADVTDLRVWFDRTP